MRLEASTKIKRSLDTACVAQAHLKQVSAGVKLTAIKLSSEFLETSGEVAKGRAGIIHLDNQR